MRQNYYFNPNQLLKTQGIKKKHIENYKREKFTNSGITTTMVLFMMAIADELEYNHDDMTRVLTKVENLAGSITVGNATLEDFNETLGEEIMIRLNNLDLSGLR